MMIFLLILTLKLAVYLDGVYDEAEEAYDYEYFPHN